VRYGRRRRWPIREGGSIPDSARSGLHRLRAREPTVFIRNFFNSFRWRDTVKLSLLHLRNDTEERDESPLPSLRGMGGLEWIEMPQRSFRDNRTRRSYGASILARNPYNNEFAQRVSIRRYERAGNAPSTCDRKEFSGAVTARTQGPAALSRVKLSGSGRARDSIPAPAAMQAVIELAPGDWNGEIVDHHRRRREC